MPSPASPSAVRVVLVRTLSEGNVGATARAMLNMGLRDLVLVDPRIEDKVPVRWMAHGAAEVIDRCTTVSSLEEAVADCTVVVATTARRRRWRSWPLLDPPEAAKLLAGCTPESPGCLVFGPEDKGLSNEDLARCTHIARIPTSDAHTSLNLAQAVLLMSYELFQQTTPPAEKRKQRQPADASQIDGAVLQLADLLERVNYFRGRSRMLVETTARQMLSKTSLTRDEIGLLRGGLRKLSWGLDNPDRVNPAREED